MTVFNGDVMTKILGSPQITPDPGNINGTVRCFNEKVTLDTQTTSDTINIGVLPKGARFLYGVLETTVTLATATLAIGIASDIDKYRVAAVKTSVVPEVFGRSLFAGDELTEEETLFLTIAVASLPSSGTLRVKLFYVFN